VHWTWPLTKLYVVGVVLRRAKCWELERFCSDRFAFGVSSMLAMYETIGTKPAGAVALVVIVSVTVGVLHS
jgi:hypothetical protein